MNLTHTKTLQPICHVSYLTKRGTRNETWVLTRHLLYITPTKSLTVLLSFLQLAEGGIT